MNTNGNIYTIVYSTIIVCVVAAILAFAASSLKPLQQANEKAETISQILSAAKLDVPSGNDAIINSYKEQIAEAYTVSLDGEKNGELSTADASVCTTSGLKAQNYKIAEGQGAALPVYVFKKGVRVVPIYGAGLWGPVWGYVAVNPDGTICGATFDHASETPGLGGKIKDEPSFRAQLEGKIFDFSDVKPIQIVKGGAPEGKANAIDAISGATMTSQGLEDAINVWIKAYKPVFDAAPACGECTESESSEN